MQRIRLTLITALLCVVPGCLGMPITASASTSSVGPSVPQPYGFYGTGYPGDRPNQLRREVVFGQPSVGKPCWKN